MAAEGRRHRGASAGRALTAADARGPWRDRSEPVRQGLAESGMWFALMAVLAEPVHGLTTSSSWSRQRTQAGLSAANTQRSLSNKCPRAHRRPLRPTPALVR